MADGFELLPHRLERFEAHGDLGPCGQSQQDAEQQEKGRERRGKAPDGGANLRGVEAHGGAHHFRPEARGQLDAALEQIERLAARPLHPMMADLVIDRFLGGQGDLEVPQRARAHHRAVRLDRHLPIQPRERLLEAWIDRWARHHQLVIRSGIESCDQLIEMRPELAVDPPLDVTFEQHGED